MTRVLAAIRGAMDKMLPWPARRQRKAAIQAARRERELSQAGAGQAAAIERAIAEMAYANHFAAAIADQIITRHGGKTG